MVSSQYSIELAFIEHPKNSHAASIGKPLAKGGLPPGELWAVTPDVVDALDANPALTRPWGRWAGVGFVECVGLIGGLLGEWSTRAMLKPGWFGLGVRLE
jgi:hypothetical protein